MNDYDEWDELKKYMKNRRRDKRDQKGDRFHAAVTVVLMVSLLCCSIGSCIILSKQRKRLR